MMEELLLSRSHFLGYGLTTKEENNQGWAGGNAPAWFADKQHLLADGTGNEYGFFLALKLPFSEDMLSIFIPQRFSVYADAKYPCGIKAFAHPVSPESKTVLYPLMPEKPEPGEALTRYQRKKDYAVPIIRKAFIGPSIKYPAGTRPFEDFIQLGGTPAWIQDNEAYYAGGLLEQGCQYVMQINEDQYLPDMLQGNYPLCYGSLYLYGQIEAGGVSGILAAFWQSS